MGILKKIVVATVAAGAIGLIKNRKKSSAAVKKAVSKTRTKARTAVKRAQRAVSRSSK